MPLTHCSHPASSHLWVRTGWLRILGRVSGAVSTSKTGMMPSPMPIPATAQSHHQYQPANSTNLRHPTYLECPIITWWLPSCHGAVVTALLWVPTPANLRATGCLAAPRGYLLKGQCFWCGFPTHQDEHWLTQDRGNTVPGETPLAFKDTSETVLDQKRLLSP